MNVELWLVNWFDTHAAVDRAEVIEGTHENYFHAGWIDSLGFITLVSEVETHFGITFSNEEFQDRRFATIAGLSEMIERKLHRDEV